MDQCLDCENETKTSSPSVYHLSDLLFSGASYKTSKSSHEHKSLKELLEGIVKFKELSETQKQITKCFEEWKQMDHLKYPFKLSYRSHDSDASIEIKDIKSNNHVQDIFYDPESRLFYIHQRISFTCSSNKDGKPSFSRPQSNQFFFDDLEHILRFIYINKYFKRNGSHQDYHRTQPSSV